MRCYGPPTMLAAVLVMAMAACGGGGTTPVPAQSSPTPSPSPTPGPTSASSGVSAPVIVTVSGADVTGIDINVTSPAGTENAELLGSTDLGEPGTAGSTGASIARGSSQKVLLFGPGLSGDMKVIIGGPNDVTVSNIRSIKATDGTPGIAFDLQVSSSARLGARSVLLQATNNDVTSFTGGLEIVP